MLRGFDKTWDVSESRVGPGFPEGDSSDSEREEGDISDERRSDVRRIHPTVRPKHEVPVLRYPVDKARSKKLHEITISKLKGRQVLFPVKKKITRQRLIPFTVVADSEDFRIFQDGEEWERVRFAVNQRLNGNLKEHFDVSTEEEVRVGPYTLCTKCANFRSRPQCPSQIYVNGSNKRSSLADTTMYQAWRRSLLELQPYLDRRERLRKQKRRKREGLGPLPDDSDIDISASEEDDSTSEDKSHSSLNFDEAYLLLTEAMNKIETSSSKTKKRLASAHKSSHKFMREATGFSAIEEEKSDVE